LEIGEELESGGQSIVPGVGEGGDEADTPVFGLVNCIGSGEEIGGGGLGVIVWGSAGRASGGGAERRTEIVQCGWSRLVNQAVHCCEAGNAAAVGKRLEGSPKLFANELDCLPLDAVKFVQRALVSTHPYRAGIFKDRTDVRFVDNEEIMGGEDPLRAAKEVHRPARLEDCLVDVRFPSEVVRQSEAHNLHIGALRDAFAIEVERRVGARSRIVAVVAFFVQPVLSVVLVEAILTKPVHVPFPGKSDKLSFGVVVGDQPLSSPFLDANKVTVERVSNGLTGSFRGNDGP